MGDVNNVSAKPAFVRGSHGDFESADVYNRLRQLELAPPLSQAKNK
jgi:hypothetical protein